MDIEYTRASNHNILFKDEFKESIKRLLLKNKKAQAMILFDSSQAPSINTDLPKGFEKEENRNVLGEVVRSSPVVVTEASKVFQRYNQDKTTNHLRKHKLQGLRPGAIIFKSESDRDNVETCAKKAIAELEKRIKFFPGENFHDKKAAITEYYV